MFKKPPVCIFTTDAGFSNNFISGSSCLSATGCSGLYGTGSVTAGGVFSPFIGNTGATLVGTTANVYGVTTTGTLNSPFIGNTGATLFGTTANVFGTLTAGTINSPFIGNTGAVLWGTTGNLTTVNSTTLNNTGTAFIGTVFSPIIGNTSATLVGTTANVYGVTTTGTLNSPFIGNTGATLWGTTANIAGTATIGNVQAAVIGNINTTLTTGTTYHAGTVWANAAVDTTTANTGAVILPFGGLSVFGNAYVGKNLYIGAAAPATTFSTPTLVAVDNSSTYAQIAVQNNTPNGSADFAAYSANGTDAGGWVDVGFTGNTFNDGNYTITKPNDGYLLTRPASNAFGGNLVLATAENGSFNDIVFGVGFQANAEVARFHGNISTSGNLWLQYTTDSSSATSGALRVSGGVGVGSNLYVGTGTTINSTQSPAAFTVKGQTSTALIYADSTKGAVVVGGAGYQGSGGNTTIQGGATFKVDSTDSLLLPVGTTAQRPGAGAGNVAVAGMVRFNSTISQMEFHDGNQWQTAGSVFTVISDRQFSDASGNPYGNVDGVNTTFTIQASSTTAATIVSINGVVQFPAIAYNVSTTSLVFTEAPALGDVIDVRVLATTSVVSSITNSNGLNQFVADNNGASLWSGTSVTIERINVDTSGIMQLMAGTKIAYDQTAVSVTTSPTTIDSFDKTVYRAAKYIITFTNGSTSYETTEVIMIHDGTTATRTQYGTISTSGSSLATYTATILGGTTVALQCAAVSGTGTVKVLATYIKV